MRTKITNRSFNRIAGIGTVNVENRIAPPTLRSKKLSVIVEQTSSHAPINVQVLVPVKRSARGSRRVASLNLSGTQARELYKTLRSFFKFKEEEEEPGNDISSFAGYVDNQDEEDAYDYGDGLE